MAESASQTTTATAEGPAGAPATLEEIRRAVDVAAGRSPGSRLLRGGRVLNVFTGETIVADVLLAGRLVAAVGADLPADAADAVDAMGGAVVAPGLIDGHVHIESSLVTPSAYAEGVVPRGVTGVVCDPHEIANVAGVDGVRWLLQRSEGLPLDVWMTVPSCVPSTPHETAGAALGPREIEALLAHPRVVGVAEIMSFPAVVAGDVRELAKVLAAERWRKTPEGHAPGLSGRDLQAYLASGISSDHESTGLAEGLEKLRGGMFLMVREGSVTRDLDALLPLVHPRHADRIGFVTDDRLPHDLMDEGGVDTLVRRAVAAGVDPAYAVRCASYNIARHYRLPRRGAVAPGFIADLIVLADVAGFRAERVYKEGAVVAEGGVLLRPAVSGATEPALDAAVRATVHLPELGVRALRMAAPAGAVRAIRALPGGVLTAAERVDPTVRAGAVVADPDRDLLKLVCVERHGRAGGIGLGLVRGFGLRGGALASSVGHDHHNLLAVGADDEDLLVALRALADSGGGFVAVEGGRVLAKLPLEIAGLVTDAPLAEVRAAMGRLDAAAAALGATLASPFMTLSFLGLAVIPELRLTDLGLVDVVRSRIVPLAANDPG